MKKNIKLIGLLLVIISILIGCSSTQNVDNTNSEKNTDTETDKPEKVTIQIDGAAVPYYAPLYIAKEKGYFEEEGLNVEFLYAAAADIVKNVAVGNVQFGFPNADSVITAKSQNIPVKVVHTTYQSGLGATIFKKDKGINSPSDLKGKTIAVTNYGSPNYIQLQVMLKQHGLSIDDVDIEIVGTGAIVNSLVVDQVDAITFSTLRTVELKKQGVLVDEFLSDEYLPSHGNVLVTSDEYLTTNEVQVKGFINALNKGMQYIIDGNVDEAIDVSIKKHATSFEGKEETVKDILNNVFIPSLWQSDLTKDKGLGAADLERWQKTIDILYEYKMIDNKIKADDFIVNLN